MTCGDNILDFTYDANGAPLTLVTGGKVYYYLTNLQGDVISVESSDGTPVASYCYDAWGKILSSSGDLAELNPLRYRGYVYDQETGFYYLQSRYYDPAIGRFINADSYASTGAGVIGCNMFAYSNNNPVLYADPAGHSFILTCVIVGAAISAIAGSVVAAVVSKKKTGKVSGWAVAGGAVAGGAVGALAGWGAGAAISAVGSATTATVASGTVAQLGNEVYKNWQSAEQGLREAIHSVADYGSRVFSTPMGNRVVDAYNTASNIIAESKYGYQAYSSFIKAEVARDAWLLQSGAVNEVQWHFYYSEASQTIGGSYPLIRALLDAGIQVYYH